MSVVHCTIPWPNWDRSGACVNTCSVQPVFSIEVFVTRELVINTCTETN